ncbi:hypothetical protein ACETU7_33210 [Rhodococcus sp. 3Y1]
MAETFLEWSRKFQPHTNEIFDWGQDYFQDAGGDPTIFYFHGYWKLAEDEAWVIETEVPNCEYFNFVLQNFWVESPTTTARTSTSTITPRSSTTTAP